MAELTGTVVALDDNNLPVTVCVDGYKPDSSRTSATGKNKYFVGADGPRSTIVRRTEDDGVDLFFLVPDKRVRILAERIREARNVCLQAARDPQLAIVTSVTSPNGTETQVGAPPDIPTAVGIVSHEPAPRVARAAAPPTRRQPARRTAQGCNSNQIIARVAPRVAWARIANNSDFS